MTPVDLDRLRALHATSSWSVVDSDDWRRGLPALFDELEALRAEVERLRRGITAVSDLIDNSHGVTGLHANGEEARWDDLRTGGQFEGWLRDFDAVKETP